MGRVNQPFGKGMTTRHVFIESVSGGPEPDPYVFNLPSDLTVVRVRRVLENYIRREIGADFVKIVRIDVVPQLPAFETNLEGL